jgi:hypothetical protein
MAPWWLPVALTIVAIALVGLAFTLELTRRELRSLGTRVEFTVEYFHKARELISHAGYGTLRAVLKEEFDRHGTTLLSIYMGTATDQAAVAKFRPGHWRYVFLSDPNDEGALVWRDSDRNVFASDCLLFSQIWNALLEGHPEREREPYLVIQRGVDTNEPVFRILLKKFPGNEPSAVLCSFPVRLLTERRPEQTRQLALRFGLRVVPNGATDHFEDEFGEAHLVFPEGEPGRVYENDLFKFSVRDRSVDRF